MIKFKVRYALNQIEKTVIIRESDTYIWLMRMGEELRESKITQSYRWFNTFEEAKLSLTDNAEKSLEQAIKQVKSAEKRLQIIKNITE